LLLNFTDVHFRRAQTSQRIQSGAGLRAVGLAYVLLGWVVLQGADFLLDLAGATEWVIRSLAIIGLIGLPFALFFGLGL
jgi:hypothetical protein